MIGAVELGLLYALLALGVYLTFRILDFPDLTVDGSFTTGAAVAAVGIINGYPPLLSTFAGVLAGMVAGVITGLLHTLARINGLLAGIITMIGLYSINLRIMGTANIGLIRQTTLMTPLREGGHLGTWVSILIFSALAIFATIILVLFLRTNFGLATRATGDNPMMIRALGANTNVHKVVGLALSNGLVAGAGALVAQYQGYADSGMGIGMIVAGLASVIIGQAVLGRRSVPRAAFAVVIGAVMYRVVIQLALSAGLNPNDMKLISAILVVLALVIPQIQGHFRTKRRTQKAAAIATAQISATAGQPVPDSGLGGDDVSS